MSKASNFQNNGNSEDSSRKKKKGGQERKTYGEGSTTLLTSRNVCEGLLLHYPSASALAWFFLHNMKSHNDSPSHPWFSSQLWPADMSTVTEMFWVTNKSGIPSVSMKISEGVSRASLLCFPSRDLGLPVCFFYSWFNISIGKIWMIPILAQWANEALISLASVDLFWYSATLDQSREARGTHGDTDGGFHFRFTASEIPHFNAERETSV